MFEKNKYIDESIEKAGTPDCDEHAYSIWEEIQNAEEMTITNDVNVLVKGIGDVKSMLKRLDELIAWTRMKFKMKNYRSCIIVKEKVKEVNFSIAGDRISTVTEISVKNTGRWYENGLTDKGIEILKKAKDGLKVIDKTSLGGKFKVRCMEYSLDPRLQWPLMMYEIRASQVKRIEGKWLGLPKKINKTAIYVEIPYFTDFFNF